MTGDFSRHISDFHDSAVLIHAALLQDLLQETLQWTGLLRQGVVGVTLVPDGEAL
jgi:hypothetical protein